jgi:hypothetical protein
MDSTEVSMTHWKQLRPRAGRVWTPEEAIALLQDFEEGLSLEDIALRLGRGVHGVEVRLVKLGRGTRREASESVQTVPPVPSPCP